MYIDSRQAFLPSAYKYLLICEKIYAVYLSVQYAEERLTETSEWEEGHWGGYSNINAYVACLNPSSKFTSISSARGEDAGLVAVIGLGVDHVDCVV